MEAFDLRAVFWDGPSANLFDLSWVCADTFFGDHMSQVRNPFLEEETLSA